MLRVGGDAGIRKSTLVAEGALRAGATSPRGVGNHMAVADIRLGDVGLDIGCGGGTDTVLAAHATGPGGKVYALDFLPETLERTRKAGEEAGVDGVVETIEGAMVAIPLPDASVDVIVSNGVINLSPRKSPRCWSIPPPGRAEWPARATPT